MVTKEMEYKEVFALLKRQEITMEDLCRQIIEVRPNYMQELGRLYPRGDWRKYERTALVSIAFKAIDNQDRELFLFTEQAGLWNMDDLWCSRYLYNPIEYVVMNQATIWVMALLSQASAIPVYHKVCLAIGQWSLKVRIDANYLERSNSMAKTHKPGPFSPYIEMLDALISIKNWVPSEKYSITAKEYLFVHINMVLQGIHTLAASQPSSHFLSQDVFKRFSSAPNVQHIPDDGLLCLAKLCKFHFNIDKATIDQVTSLQQTLLSYRVFSKKIVDRVLFRTIAYQYRDSWYYVGSLSKIKHFITARLPLADCMINLANLGELRSFPTEILLKIYESLPLPVLLNLALTCKYNYSFVCGQDLLDANIL